MSSEELPKKAESALDKARMEEIRRFGVQEFGLPEDATQEEVAYMGKVMSDARLQGLAEVMRIREEKKKTV